MYRSVPNQFRFNYQDLNWKSWRKLRSSGGTKRRRRKICGYQNALELVIINIFDMGMNSPCRYVIWPAFDVDLKRLEFLGVILCEKAIYGCFHFFSLNASLIFGTFYFLKSKFRWIGWSNKMLMLINKFLSLKKG